MQLLKQKLNKMQSDSVALICSLAASNKNIGGLICAIDNEDMEQINDAIRSLGVSLRYVADCIEAYCDASAGLLKGETDE